MIELLTEDERDMLELAAPLTGAKAMRIIDAQAAEVERLRARLDNEFTHDQLLLEVCSYRSGMMAAESHLAAANALLERWESQAGGFGPVSLYRATRAHLAAQPASAAGRTGDTVPREPGCECHWETGDSPCIAHGLYEAESPTRAEAELARRGLK